MSNVKPGDLAIVINGPLTGMIVNVIRFMLEGQFHGEHHTTIAGWLVESSSAGVFVGRDGTRFAVTVIVDAWLKPVSGLSDAEFSDEQQPIRDAL